MLIIPPVRPVSRAEYNKVVSELENYKATSEAAAKEYRTRIKDLERRNLELEEALYRSDNLVNSRIL